VALNRTQKRREPIFCGRCGRLTFADLPEFEWWLHGPDYGSTVIRCPAHITEWTLRTSGKGRSKAAWRFRRLAQENDQFTPDLAGIEPLFVEDDI